MRLAHRRRVSAGPVVYLPRATIVYLGSSCVGGSVPFTFKPGPNIPCPLRLGVLPIPLRSPFTRERKPSLRPVHLFPLYDMTQWTGPAVRGPTLSPRELREVPEVMRARGRSPERVWIVGEASVGYDPPSLLVARPTLRRDRFGLNTGRWLCPSWMRWRRAFLAIPTIVRLPTTVLAQQGTPPRLPKDRASRIPTVRMVTGFPSAAKKISPFFSPA